MKALKIGANQVGTRYAIVPMKGTYWVWVECKNYSGQVRGGIQTTWRYCEKDLTLEAAEQVFTKKLNGKTK